MFRYHEEHLSIWSQHPDLRGLKDFSPKDGFPRPHIDLLDNTAKAKIFSFMDGFSSYDQIKMVLEYMEKTTFMGHLLVITFRLENVGATYQQAMTTLFHDMMHKEIELYVDDVTTKSKDEEKHLDDLLKLFQGLRKFRLRLNPNKCTFGVR